MATSVAVAHETSALDAPVRRLLLIWQNPQSRRFSRVGRLTEDAEGYAFEYLEGARHPDFVPLPSFPRLDETYRSPHLPSFFRNRVMSRARSSYARYVDWLGIDIAHDDVPYEVLARTGAGRATDTFHVVPEPEFEGQAVIRFFASGLRHVSGSQEILGSIEPGQELMLRDEPDNPQNPLAVMIDKQVGEPLGWVPDWLVDDVHELRRSAAAIKVVAEQVNSDAPWHLKLLCRLQADFV